MAPEVSRGELYTSKCDVYSFAIIMYEVLFNTVRPYGATYVNIENIVAKDPAFRPALPLPKANSEKEIQIYKLVKWCWDDDANTRPSFDEICPHLERLLVD